MYIQDEKYTRLTNCLKVLPRKKKQMKAVGLTLTMSLIFSLWDVSQIPSLIIYAIYVYRKNLQNL